MNSLVSIIIPVYNLENYIENCLNSITTQTYKNLEILCIDDGSTDKSSEVIQSLAKNDDRIKYIKKENGGVSSARNLGLDTATGEYIMFVDGDDYIHPQAVEIFYSVITETECDMVSANYLSTESLTQNYSDLINSNGLIVDYFDFFIKEKPIISQSNCGKLFSTKCLKNVKFNEKTIFYEDTLFNFEILLNKPKICLIPEILYFYFSRPGSTTKSEYKPKSVHTVSSFSNLCKKLVDFNEMKLFSQAAERMFKFGLTIRTRTYGTQYYQEVKKVFNKARKRWFKMFFVNKFVSFKTKLSFLVFCYSRPIYELFRLITDPTMKDFYKNRKNIKG